MVLLLDSLPFSREAVLSVSARGTAITGAPCQAMQCRGASVSSGMTLETDSLPVVMRDGGVHLNITIGGDLWVNNRMVLACCLLNWEPFGCCLKTRSTELALTCNLWGKLCGAHMDTGPSIVGDCVRRRPTLTL